MSLYEKIATAIIALLVLGIVGYSYKELKEPKKESAEKPNSAFDQSMGPNFIIGPYHNTISTTVTGGLEDNCAALKPVLAGTLHDIKERLEHAKAYTGHEDPFEINEATLDALCNKNAQIVLGGDASSTLVLQKLPFRRVVPQGSTQEDVGTVVHINATVVPLGAAQPSTPTTFGEQMIPDRYLDDVSTSTN